MTPSNKPVALKPVRPGQEIELPGGKIAQLASRVVRREGVAVGIDVASAGRSTESIPLEQLTAWGYRLIEEEAE